jgi:hypothetical protein
MAVFWGGSTSPAESPRRNGAAAAALGIRRSAALVGVAFLLEAAPRLSAGNGLA